MLTAFCGYGKIIYTLIFLQRKDEERKNIENKIVKCFFLSDKQYRPLLSAIKQKGKVMIMDFFKKICEYLNLGGLVSPPVRLRGGLTHKMHRLECEKGKYAVKLLNPYIMKRPEAMGNYRRAEQLEDILADSGVPVIPALSFNGKKMQELDGNFFYVFDFYGGRPVHGRLIHKGHCEKMGRVLADIHKTETMEKHENFNGKFNEINWKFYCEKIKDENCEISRIFCSRLPILEEFGKKTAEALKKIPPVTALCHNDMDSKNVLWQGGEYRIIDLECLSYSSPFIEMYETALCWSGLDECDLDCQKLTAFIQAYTEAGGYKPIDPEILFYSSKSRLEWLEYNLKRILGIDCGESEREIGISESADALDHISYYYNMKDEIIGCIANVIS